MMTGDGLLAHHRLRDGEGTPLVLLHGFPLDSRMWHDVVPLLSGSFPVLALDLPGMGSSPSGHDVAQRLSVEDVPSVDLQADAVADTLAELGIDRAVVAGLSMGGYTLLSLLERHAWLLAGAALLDTKASADTAEARANRLRIADEVESSARVDEVLGMRRSVLGETSRVERLDLVERIDGWIRAQGPAGIAWCQRAMASRPDRHEALRAFEGPVAVIVGDEDELSPVADAQAMVDSAQDAVLTIVPRAGHMTPIEQPEPVAAALAQLVARA
ncbi:alpha/beta fold hydrolase [Sanguibacter sp. A247]|uniref:alpha/beta fold hydrolase n=1 Tax=unclassified Sanguibacter TaxID=2645534 RepID=UPI003FD7252E